MCGICGIIDYKKDYSRSINRKIVEGMVESISHRGPDGRETKVLDENVCFGHCRLSIIDLFQRAAQPMSDATGRYTIVFNGEIYNYKELRNTIKKDNIFHFKTESDTEVLLASYMKWGIECLEYLNGIFAFAVYDSKTREVLLVRDRYGTKPLYYTKTQDKVIFSSEYKAFYKSPDFDPELDLFAVKEYFTFQNIFSDRSFLKNVKILQPGCYLKINAMADDDLKLVRYWDFNFTEDELNISDEEYEEELNRLFVKAVERQLVSDVEIGTYLSGGIDSGGITAIVANNIRNLKTFTCGMDLHSASGIELTFDEREAAEHLSYIYGTEHYEIVLKAGDMERCMEDLVWHLEDPRVGQSYPNYYASKLASNFVKVVLAGTGGDELFAGYPWRYYIAINSDSMDDYLKGYYNYWQRLLDEKAQIQFFAPIYDEIKDYEMKNVFNNMFSTLKRVPVSSEKNVNNSLYLEAKTFLHGLLLVEDKLSMAFGLESRVPFLDNDLVDFAMRLPVKYKLRNINSTHVNENSLFEKTKVQNSIEGDGKLLLRKVMNRYLPEVMVNAKKQGFSSPDASWFRGESLDYINGVISNPNAKIYEYLDRKSVRHYFDEHIEGKNNNRLLIWSVLNFDTWLRMFL